MVAQQDPARLSLTVDRFRDGAWTRDPDPIAVEAPLELRISSGSGARPITITMRTPGNDFELAAGFLYSEGIVAGPDDIVDVRHSDDVMISEDDRQNTVVVTLRAGLVFDLKRMDRNFTQTSACGVCGKESLNALGLGGCRPLAMGTTITADVLRSLPSALRSGQAGFDATGGVHAVGLFDTSGQIISLREDVGRHNAFDKMVGQRLLARKMAKLQQSVAVLSGRASYELLQKALIARIPIVAAIGAPSSLAVEIASTFNITLVGFLKAGSFNVYAGRERICD
ncbi:MAG TPA: formate dehydrogenase accessory sulfurtransferase FdhD [Tepidiformaceae bacterium]